MKPLKKSKIKYMYGFAMRVALAWESSEKRVGFRKGRVNVMGGLRYHEKKWIFYFIEKGESETFYSKIRSLNDSGKKEWIDPGNKESYFSVHGPRIIVLLDNVLFHKKKEIIDRIEK